MKRIVPLFTNRCGVKLNMQRIEKRFAHWKGIVIGACEQSGRCVIPELTAPQAIENWLSQPKRGLKLVCDPHQTQSPQILDKITNCSMLIGPEGGLTSSEIQLAQRQGFLSMSLGPRILRTETATISAVSMLQARWGDLH